MLASVQARRVHSPWRMVLLSFVAVLIVAPNFADAETWNTSTVSGSQAVGVQNIPFTIVSSSAAWPARYGHTVAASGSNLVLMGGINWWNASDATHNLTDVWSSADLGATWTQLWKVAPFGIRHGATSVLVSDAILLIAGDSLDAATEGDVWSSSDLGVSWSEVNSAAFSARSFHTSTVDIETGTIVVASGLSAAGVPLNDVYTSTDSGVTWTTATSDAEFSARYGASSFWRKSVVYIVGGVTITDGVVEATNDIWRSEDDGESWTVVLSTLPSGVGPRAFFASASFANYIYVLAGSAGADYVRATSTDTIYGDVWKSSDSGATWSWQESTASFGARGGVASVLTGGTFLVLGGVARGQVYRDVFSTALPTGDPDADGGVVAGILGAAAGLMVFVYAARHLFLWARDQAKRRRDKSAKQLEAVAAAGQGGSALLADMDQHDDH